MGLKMTYYHHRCSLCKGDRQLVKITTEYGTEFFFRGGIINGQYAKTELVPCYQCNRKEYEQWQSSHSKPQSPHHTPY